MPPNARARAIMLRVRLAPEEYAELRRRALVERVTLSTFVRRRLPLAPGVGPEPVDPTPELPLDPRQATLTFEKGTP